MILEDLVDFAQALTKYESPKGTFKMPVDVTFVLTKGELKNLQMELYRRKNLDMSGFEYHSEFELSLLGVNFYFKLK